MGATLPAISRWVKATPEGISWLGFFYGGNIAGGVIGSLTAGFYLLRVYDVMIATFAAVVLNVVVAATAIALSGRTTYTAEGSQVSTAVGSGNWAVYTTIALSGLTALGSEVVWTRILSLHFGATVYTFSLILAVFLVGLGIGSTAGAITRPGKHIAATCARLAASLSICARDGVGGVLMNTESLPYWPINPSISTSPWLTLQLDLVRAFWVVLPGAVLWGASFPLALAAVASHRSRLRLVSPVASTPPYRWRDSWARSVVSFPVRAWIGTSHFQQVLIVVSAISALADAQNRRTTGAATGRKKSWNVGATALLAGAMVVGRFAGTKCPSAFPGLLVAYGRYAATRIGQADIIYSGEGLNAAVAVSQLSNGVLNYHNAGKVQASASRRTCACNACSAI